MCTCKAFEEQNRDERWRSPPLKCGDAAVMLGCTRGCIVIDCSYEATEKTNAS
jgi:hypothetical protein